MQWWKKQESPCFSCGECQHNLVYTAPGRKASDCVKCGKCEKVCPQHLQIRNLLEDVVKEFEAERA